MKSLSFVAKSAKRTMKLWFSRKHFLGLILAVAGTFVGATSGILLANDRIFHQTVEKKVSLESRKTPHDQIKFSDLRLGEAAKDFEESFAESKGWIGKTSFKIENISDKDITFLSIKVLFPETTATGPVMAFSFSFGNRPGSKIQTAKPLKFAKGEKMTINLAEQYQRIVNFVSQRYEIEKINQIDIEASFIVFADGTAWTVGQFIRQDPKDPDRWLQVQMQGYIQTKPDEEKIR
jgi:hypothetical protein